MGKWDTSEGGALPGADGPVAVEVTSASFNYDAGYNNGETLVFILEGECDHEYWNGYQIYSIGNGWETDDNVVVEGKDEFVQSTNFARFFRAAIEDEDLLAALNKNDSDDIGPRDASIWEGLTLLLERKEYPGFGPNADPKHLLVPVGMASKAKKKKGKKGKAEASNGGDLRKKVVKLAGKHDDHDEFVEAVLNKYPEVEDDDALYDEVLDEDGIFEEVNG